MDERFIESMLENVKKDINNLSIDDRARLFMIEAIYASDELARALIDLLMSIMAASYMKKSVMLEMVNKLTSILESVDKSNKGVDN